MPQIKGNIHATWSEVDNQKNDVCHIKLCTSAVSAGKSSPSDAGNRTATECFADKSETPVQVDSKQSGTGVSKLLAVLAAEKPCEKNTRASVRKQRVTAKKLRGIRSESKTEMVHFRDTRANFDQLRSLGSKLKVEEKDLQKLARAVFHHGLKTAETSLSIAEELRP